MSFLPSPRFRRPLRGPATVLLALPPLAALLLAGCDIAAPEMPRFTTTLNIPFERQELVMEELVEDEDLLFSDGSGGLSIFLEGDSLRVDLEPDLSLELEPRQEDFALGAFTLEAGQAGDFEYGLLEVYPGAGELPPGTVPVPPFEFALQPGPRDIAGVRSAHVESGQLRASVVNGFQVPLSGPEPPLTLRCEIRAAAGGELLAVVEFPGEIGPGESDTRLADLAGATLPDSVTVSIVGGSPGHPGVEDLDTEATLGIVVDFVDLRVDEALAELGEQSLSETRRFEIGDSLRIIEASIAAGVLDVTLGNQMPLPVEAELIFEEILDGDGLPVSAWLELPPGDEESVQLDLAGARIVSGAEPLDSLSYRVELSSPGSGGEAVQVDSASRLSASISAGTLELGECSGYFPERSFALDPVSEELDLPEELAGVHFSEASLVLDVLNELQFPAQLSIKLKSFYGGGDSLQLSHQAEIAPAEGRGATLTRVVLDASNSELPALLSGAPERIELSGEVRVGGDEPGTAAPGQGAEVSWSVEAPLRASIEPTEVRRDPFELDLDEDLRRSLSERLHAARLLAEIDNALPLALELRFLVGADSASVHSDPLREIGPFTVAAAPLDGSGFASGSLQDDQELVLEREDVLDLVAAGHYVAVVVDMPGTGGAEIAFRPEDYLAVRGILQAEIQSTEH